MQNDSNMGMQDDNGDHDDELSMHDNSGAKQQNTMCLNLAGSDFEKSNVEHLVHIYEASKPLLVVMSDDTDRDVIQRIWQLQRERMRYAVHFSDRHTVANSIQVIAQLKINHMLENESGVDEDAWKGEVKHGVHVEELGDELVDPFGKQAEYDEMQLFLSYFSVELTLRTSSRHS